MALITYKIMADDISKKIAIEVNLEAEQVTKNIKTINDAIDGLVAKQQQLTTAGQQNSAAFNDVSAALLDFQKKLQDVNTQVTTNTASLNDLTKAAKDLGNSMSSVAAEHQKNAKAAGDTTVKTKTLNVEVSSLNKTVVQQKSNLEQSKVSLDGYGTEVTKTTSAATKLTQSVSQVSISMQQGAGAVTENKTAFDAHAATMEHLRTSFDEIKDVSGIFGPSLQEAAKGFGVMKSGLTLVQDGFKGVGAAIKADGFGFLLEILQMMFDYFVKSSQGSKILKGAISAVGVVINKVKTYFHEFMDGVINAFSHPVDTLKSLGNLIGQNLINRFRAFGVILDGIIHLDFKKVANGAIQAFTGVANATDKIKAGFVTVRNGLVTTAKEMADAYKKGFSMVDKHVSNHEKHVKKSVDRQLEMFKKAAAAADGSCPCETGQANSETGDTAESNTGKSEEDNDGTTGADTGKKEISDKKAANKKISLWQQTTQKIEDFAKQSESKIAAYALNTLTDSIKRQSDAKIAALEKEKQAALSSSNLTASQKLAVEEKYKKKEAAVKEKAFKQEKEVAIAQAIINGAMAITKAESQTGVLGALVIPAIIAETAVQVAKIAAQKPPAYAAGGLHYTSNGRGGVLPGYSRTDNTNAYLRSGEAVVVSEAMQVPWARNLVSAINVGFGGRDFSITNPGKGYAVGGIFTDGGDANRYYNQPVNDQKNLANTIAYQMINNFPPVYVDVKDVNNQQNILAQTINRVNL